MKTDQELFESVKYLVVNIANKYARNYHELQDMIGEGNLAVVLAIKKYNYNNKFSSFALKYIHNALKTYLWKIGHDGIFIPRTMLRHAKKLRKNPDMEMSKRYKNFIISALNLIARKDEKIKKIIYANTNFLEIDIAKILNNLSEIEKSVIKYNFGIDCEKLSQKKISKKMNIPPKKIKLILDESLIKLKNENESNL